MQPASESSACLSTRHAPTIRDNPHPPIPDFTLPGIGGPSPWTPISDLPPGSHGHESDRGSLPVASPSPSESPICRGSGIIPIPGSHRGFRALAEARTRFELEMTFNTSRRTSALRSDTFRPLLIRPSTNPHRAPLKALMPNCLRSECGLYMSSTGP